MIRPFTCLCLMIAGGSGLYLYTAKHDAQMLDREISKLSRQAQDSRARAAMMRAEYDRLGDPERLRELADQVLTLKPTDPQQYTSLADLDRRLPAVAPLPVQPAPEEAKPEMVVATAATEARVAMADHIVPEKPFAEKLPIEKALQIAPPAPLRAQVFARQTPAVVAPPPPAAIATVVQRPSLIASAQAAPMPAYSQAAVSAWKVLPAPVARPITTTQRPAPAQAPAVVSARRAPAAREQFLPATVDSLTLPVSNTTVDTSAPSVGSSLGMARTVANNGFAPSSLGSARR